MNNFLQQQNFLPDDLMLFARQVARDQRTFFVPTQVTPPKPGLRESMVLHASHFGELHEAFRLHLWSRLPSVLFKLKYDLPRASMELQMTRHGHGDYFKKHIDCGTDATQHRRISFVYYFHLDGSFSGGELRLYRGVCYQLRRLGTLRIFNPFPIIVEPEFNSCVFFDSRITHEVTTVTCGEGWEHGRFSINGWLVAPIIKE